MPGAYAQTCLTEGVLTCVRESRSFVALAHLPDLLGTFGKERLIVSLSMR